MGISMCLFITFEIYAEDFVDLVEKSEELYNESTEISGEVIEGSFYTFSNIEILQKYVEDSVYKEIVDELEKRRGKDSSEPTFCKISNHIKRNKGVFTFMVRISHGHCYKIQCTENSLLSIDYINMPYEEWLMLESNSIDLRDLEVLKVHSDFEENKILEYTNSENLSKVFLIGYLWNYSEDYQAYYIYVDGDVYFCKYNLETNEFSIEDSIFTLEEAYREVYKEERPMEY